MTCRILAWVLLIVALLIFGLAMAMPGDVGIGFGLGILHTFALLISSTLFGETCND